MIRPHGSERLRPLFVDDQSLREQLMDEAISLPKMHLNSAAAANAVMLGAGYFTPLDGYMGLADTLAVSEQMHTRSGLFWPVPVINRTEDVESIKHASRIALCDPNVEDHPILAIQEVHAIEQINSQQLEDITQQIFGTLSKDHPGVATFLSLGSFLISGPIQVLNYSYFKTMFADTFCTAGEIRDAISAEGWERVVAFQTRNPMHRAHEALCKMAKDAVSADGILIHMLLGKLKAGDIPATVRDAAIRKMVSLYFPKHTVLIAGYGFDMLYAGPKEALLHALFRQNAGCSHLIVGRDHAGVGDYYGAFDAQAIFKQIPRGALSIEIFEADHTAYSLKLNEVIMMRDAPEGHTKEDFVLLSGTRVREMLESGQTLPEEFARPEVAKILMEYYQSAS